MDINSSLNELFGGEPEPTSQDRIADALEILVRHKTDGRLIKENAQLIQEQEEEERRHRELIKEELRQQGLLQEQVVHQEEVNEEFFAPSSGAEYTKEEPKTFVDQYADALTYATQRMNDASGKVENTELDLTMENFQQQLDRMRRTIVENTLVSGIGQGGDGQTPGSGEVKLARLDDVIIDNINDGDTLVWDSTTNSFVAGAGGGGGGGAVSQIIAGTGIDIDPAGGIGNVEISTDLALEDLSDITGGPAESGDLIVHTGTSWRIGHLTTDQLNLQNPNPFFRNKFSSIIGSYNNQADANEIFSTLFVELDDRINTLEDASTPGTFLGLIDVTDASNEPADTDALNSGDYYIHDGATGALWGVGDSVDDGNQVIWDGSTWKIVATVSTLAQLGDTDTDGSVTGDLLVYDDGDSKWKSQTVSIPKVTVDTSPPATGNEKNGDFYFDQANEVLYIYDSVWTVAGGAGGASVVVQQDPPLSPEEGDLFVENDDYTLYVFHNSNWIGLTNRGLAAGGAGGGTDGDYLPSTGGVVDGDVTITSLSNVGIGSVGADASGKLIILDQNVLPSVTLNYYEYMYRAFNPTRDEDLADCEMVYYQIGFEKDEDHSVTVLHEIDQAGNNTWVDADTLKGSLNIVNVASTQVVFYGPDHGTYPSDTATNFPNLKIRTTITSGSGASQVTVMTPEVSLFDGDPKKVVVNARSSGEEDINGYVDNSTFNYAVSQVGNRIQSIVAESTDFADFQTRIAAINF